MSKLKPTSDNVQSVFLRLSEIDGSFSIIIIVDRNVTRGYPNIAFLH